MLACVHDLPLDALDLSLIHALQIRARIPWTALGGVLGVDAATLMRRWRRLVEHGVAYVTVIPSQPLTRLSLAHVEVACFPSHLQGITDKLAADQATVTIDATATGRQLITSVVGRSMDAIARWALALGDGDDRLTAIHTAHVVALVGEPTLWAPRALSQAQVVQVRRWDRQAPKAASLAPTELSDLVEALTQDFRAPIADLAARIGLSTRRVSEALSSMIAADELAFRIDVARPATSTPILVWYFLRAPAARLTAVATQLSGIARVRSVSKTSGAANLMVSCSLRSLEDMERLEEAIEGRQREVAVLDRTVVTRTAKHVGHLLDPDGLATRGRVRIAPA